MGVLRERRAAQQGEPPGVGGAAGGELAQRRVRTSRGVRGVETVVSRDCADIAGGGE
ncbi:hypothetical protein ND748_07730 [Frankia sp. AiPs1]|uniref:hypothetical protein n=1 Tax=Frankia sp. AiPs1 TaxID=573493 RepID=UPI0020448C94|nr:hypothetical protein [Frankia sp. AiPs1]MCM3921554.1 hypothetical protein [Frankia sp. AiPs1]